MQFFPYLNKLTFYSVSASCKNNRHYASYLWLNRTTRVVREASLIIKRNFKPKTIVLMRLLWWVENGWSSAPPNTLLAFGYYWSIPKRTTFTTYALNLGYWVVFNLRLIFAKIETQLSRNCTICRSHDGSILEFPRVVDIKTNFITRWWNSFAMLSSSARVFTW